MWTKAESKKKKKLKHILDTDKSNDQPQSSIETTPKLDYSIQSDTKEASPPPPQPEEVPVSPPAAAEDHEDQPAVEEPAKPEGELIPITVQPVETPEPEVNPEEEVEEETELIDGGES
jgi:hypothetical protein